MNCINLVGRLVVSPLAQKRGDDGWVCYFRLAVKPIGGPSSEAQFFNCVCYGQTAIDLEKYMEKGGRVAILGACQVDEWRVGNESYSKLLVKCRAVEFLDNPRNAKKTQETEPPF